MDEIEVVPGPAKAGERLKAAREAAGIHLSEVAARTRIPQRHLEAIEADDFGALPSTTYSVGFARAYARVVGADEVAIAAAVRSQLENSQRERHDYQAFEPADPSRVPPRGLAWIAGIVALLLLVGYAVWRAEWLFGPGAEAPVAAPAEAPAPSSPAAPAPAAAPALPANAPVVVTAVDTVWLRINDATGKRLFEKEMQANESYALPADAAGATLTTGRPNMLAVTVGGVPVPPLGEAERLVRNVPIDAAALRARLAAPAPAGAATPAPTAPAPAPR